MKPRITEAVILMAGLGSRLRPANANVLKPLVPIRGRPLVSYTIDAVLNAGIKKIVAVVGFECELLKAKVAPLVPSGIELDFAYNPEWKKQNGVSVLAATAHVSGPFLLTMSDHLFEPKIIPDLLRKADLTKTNLAVDRKIESIFDLDDATKVRTQNDQILAIGKGLPDFDAIDTGLFVCSVEVFDYLRRAMRDGDCSLSDGLQLMAGQNPARAVDIGDAWWQDVDTPEMLLEAERRTKSWNRAGPGGLPHDPSFPDKQKCA